MKNRGHNCARQVMQQKMRKSLLTDYHAESELGFSLVEVLLSIALTILLTHIIIQLSIHLVKQQTWLKERITLAENAQFAEFILKKAIQTVGFCGCNRLDQLDIHYHLSRSYLPMIPIQIFSRNASGLGKSIHPESDVLMIEKMSEKTEAFSGYSSANVIKATNRTKQFEIGEPLVIADCTQADIFVPATISYQPFSQLITATKPLIGHYCRADIGKLSVTAFFVEKTHRNDQHRQSVKALYSYDFVHHRKTEWFAGVEAMEFFYAIGHEGDNYIMFKPLSSETDLSMVRLIKIVLWWKGESISMSKEKIPPRKQEILIYLRELL